MSTEHAAGAALELRDVVKRYGGQAAVDRVSLDIRAGEFITFLGPSGSGKTTTLNMVAGFTDVTDGDILMDGDAISALPPHKRNIGMVFQHYALFPHMTAAENVGFPLKQRKVRDPELRERVERALAMVRLEEFGGRYPRQLSGGQQQRVALARAIVFEPRVLLMDEPLGALDKKLREWLQLEIKRIHSELGITFIYVTHDQEEALVLSDRIAIFRDGRIDQLGTAEDLYERPRTLFVAEFVGDSNVLPGRVSGAGDHVEVAGDGYRLRAVGDGRLPDGAPAAVIVRPERLRVADDGADAGAGANTLDATIRQVMYLGSTRRLELEFSGGRRGQLREPSNTPSPRREGDAIRVTWAAEDGVVVPDDDTVDAVMASDVPMATA
jgi:putative spermidine/putrescine transport system ATP-binding protein